MKRILRRREPGYGRKAQIIGPGAEAHGLADPNAPSRSTLQTCLDVNHVHVEHLSLRELLQELEHALRVRLLFAAVSGD